MIERNSFIAGKDKNDIYNGVLFDFRLIDFLNPFRFNKVKEDQKEIEGAIFNEKILNDDLTHKSIKEMIKSKGNMTIKESHFQK